MRQSALTGPIMLNSWKEIASYLDRGVRTVQRWERELQLPVHRIGKGKRSPVYAIATELKLWLCTAEIPHPKKTQVKPIPRLQVGQTYRRFNSPADGSALTGTNRRAKQHSSDEADRNSSYQDGSDAATACSHEGAWIIP